MTMAETNHVKLSALGSVQPTFFFSNSCIYHPAVNGFCPLHREPPFHFGILVVKMSASKANPGLVKTKTQKMAEAVSTSPKMPTSGKHGPDRHVSLGTSGRNLFDR